MLYGTMGKGQSSQRECKQIQINQPSAMEFSKYSCDTLAFVSFLCALAYFLRAVFSVLKIQTKILVQKHYNCLYRLLRRDAVHFRKSLSTFRRNIFHLSHQKIMKAHLRRLLYIYPKETSYLIILWVFFTDNKQKVLSVKLVFLLVFLFYCRN